MRPWLALLLAVSLALSACGRNMFDQPRYGPYDESVLFEDRSSARLPVEGTVPRERGGLAPEFLTGQDEAGFLLEVPFPVTMEVLERGQQSYNIYCAPCHNYDGGGEGMIVQRGFPQPASFHDARLQDAPVGYFYNAMTVGFGRMFPYDSRMPPEDRWAVAAYIRALQLSQHATLDDVPGALRDSSGALRAEGESR